MMKNKTHIRKLFGGSFSAQTIALLVLVLAMTFLVVGCDDDPVDVNDPPSAPDGVYSVTGDEQVTICWNKNPEPDIAGYDIYWNDEPTGLFERIATVGPNQTCYIDTDVDNSTTYFYAIKAFDFGGLESEFSVEDVFDTPRPEGFNLVLESLGQDPTESGYDFSTLSSTAQPWNLSSTDVYFDSPGGIPTLFGKGANVGVGVDIQDYGYIDLIDVDWAPERGWAPSKRAELIEGHSYVVQIEDGAFYQYAKVYVVAATDLLVVLDWAYQEDPGNPELTPEQGGEQK